MSNWQKWMLTLGLGMLGGIVQAASSSQSPEPKDYVRSAIIGLGPAIVALNTTLQKGQ